MRAPSYKGLREDKAPREVVREDRRRAEPRSRLAARAARLGPRRCSTGRAPARGRARGAVEGRRLKLSNWDKVLFPETGFTKGDLIAYYARIAPAVLPASARPPADSQALSQRRRGAVLL